MQAFSQLPIMQPDHQQLAAIRPAYHTAQLADDVENHSQKLSINCIPAHLAHSQQQKQQQNNHADCVLTIQCCTQSVWCCTEKTQT